MRSRVSVEAPGRAALCHTGFWLRREAAAGGGLRKLVACGTADGESFT